MFFDLICGVWICFQDQVLTGMQQKLDDLCQQLSLVKVSGDGDDLESKFKEKFGSENVKFVECGCLLCDQHHHSSPAVQVCVCVLSSFTLSISI